MARISLPARTYIRKPSHQVLLSARELLHHAVPLLTVVSSPVGVDRHEIAAVTNTLRQRMCRGLSASF